MRIRVGILACLCLVTPLLLSRADDTGDTTSAFGKEQAGDSALMGIFYDLKQTQDGAPTNVNIGNYGKVLIDFVKNGWNEDELNRFYRASRPLFTTQI